MSRERKSPRWHSCPECGDEAYDRRANVPGRKWQKCAHCGHVWYPFEWQPGMECQKQDVIETKADEKKTLLQKIFG